MSGIIDVKKDKTKVRTNPATSLIFALLASFETNWVVSDVVSLFSLAVLSASSGRSAAIKVKLV